MKVIVDERPENCDECLFKTIDNSMYFKKRCLLTGTALKWDVLEDCPLATIDEIMVKV